jgi:hypothetical protein
MSLWGGFEPAESGKGGGLKPALRTTPAGSSIQCANCKPAGDYLCSFNSFNSCKPSSIFFVKQSEVPTFSDTIIASVGWAAIEKAAVRRAIGFAAAAA